MANTKIWAKILKQAEEARILLSGKSTQERGLAIFDDLVKAHPKDGMVHFKRAEACEAFRDIARSAENYRMAQSLFPKKIWRDLALSRAERLEFELEETRINEQVKIGLGPCSDSYEYTSIAESAVTAGRFTRTNPFVSIELSRTSLVRAVQILETRLDLVREREHEFVRKISWSQRLTDLEPHLSRDIVRSMKDLLKRRDGAVYRDEPVSGTQATSAYVNLLEFFRKAFAEGHSAKR